MQPIIVRKRDFKSVNLIGLVVGVYRKMRVVIAVSVRARLSCAG